MESDTRIGARRHAVVREVNARIRELAESTGSDPLEFFCECSDPLCAETMPLALEEYDAARAHTSLVLVRPGHDVAGLGSVVAGNARFAIVEARGEAARLLDA